MQAIFTGFDSAWGPSNSGAICDLLLEGNSLRLVAEPIPANWEVALARAGAHTKVDLHVWAIDQPLLVPNENGCRPVDRQLASALMGEFGCGAHSANRGMAAFRDDAPVWRFLDKLEQAGYRQNCMAIPRAEGGRFYFECYPHPALLGLFDLGGILKYKVQHKNSFDWQVLIRQLQSLATSEFPIKGIENFVRGDLQQNKRNEDKLDALIAAYVAAYWWRFGTRRSTIIGDNSTGYMVTPHSTRTFAALARVFTDQRNPEGTVGARAATTVHDHRQSLESTGLPRCDWVYFATTAKWSGTVTGDFVAQHRIIVRSVYNTAGQCIANVQHLKPGQRILLVHGGAGTPYRPLFSCTIAKSATPVMRHPHRFDVFALIDSALNEKLIEGRYHPDPVVGRFTGITIDGVQDLRDISTLITRPKGNNTIWEWDRVFSEERDSKP